MAYLLQTMITHAKLHPLPHLLADILYYSTAVATLYNDCCSVSSVCETEILITCG